MAKDPFLLVSLEESESKALAQVISNDTARKILDYLSKHDGATETDISKNLKIAISTVHYNLQALLKANLVQTEEFHYSEKGKEVLHYSLANKLIIIAPKKVSSESLKDKLKSLLPIGIISVAAAALIQVYQMSVSSLFAAKSAAPQLMAAGVESAVQDVTPSAKMMALQAAPIAAQTVVTPDFVALWFLAGSLFTILLIAVWHFFSYKKKNK